MREACKYFHVMLLHASNELTLEAHSFLDDIARLSSPLYQPTDQDVLRARLRTVGMQECTFTMENGQDHISRYAIKPGASRLRLPPISPSCRMVLTRTL